MENITSKIHTSHHTNEGTPYYIYVGRMGIRGDMVGTGTDIG